MLEPSIDPTHNITSVILRILNISNHQELEIFLPYLQAKLEDLMKYLCLVVAH